MLEGEGLFNACHECDRGGAGANLRQSADGRGRQHDFHRKNCLTKLGLYANILSGVTACFDTVIQDSATPKQQVETYKAKRDAYSKAKESVSHYRDSLKKVEAEEEAKKLIEKMEFAH